MNKILTISIAAYNVEKTLNHVLDSLLSEEDINDKMEIIIENDGSIDGTRQIAEQYVNLYPNTIIINNKDNGGYGSTINESIKIATGTYFKQLDGDDWFETSNLRAFIGFLTENDSDLIYSPHYIVKQKDSQENKTLISLFDDNTSKSINLSEDQLPDEIGMHGLTIKTELLKKHNILLTEKCFYTDFEYVFFPVVFAETLSVFKYPVYNYVLGREGQSVSLAGEKKHYKDRIMVFMRTAEYYEKNHNTINRNKRAFLEKKISNLAGDMYNSILLVVEKSKQRELLEEIDNRINKEFPSVYKVTNYRKSVLLLRKLQFSMMARKLVRCRIMHRYV